MSTFLELGGNSLAAMRLQSALLCEPSPLAISLDELLSNTPIGQVRLSATDAQTPQPRGASDQWIPLTHSQLIPWIDQQADPESTRYIFHAIIDFDCAPAERDLRDALQRLVAEFPVLSPAFRVDTDSGVVLQRLGGLGDADYVEAQGDEALTDTDLIAAVNAGRPFRLGSEPLVRWTVVRRPDGGARLIHTEHHLVHDGVSFNLILDELREPGSARSDFGEFATAESRRHVDSDRDRAAVIAAKLKQTGPAPEVAESALGSRVPARALRFPVPSAILSAARDRAKTAGISTFVRLLTDFSDAVARELSRDSVALAVAVANRPPQFASTIGMFVSTFPVIVHAGGSDSAAQAAAEQLRAALDGPALNYAELVSAVQDREASLPFVGFSEHVQKHSNGSLFGAPCKIRPGISNGLAKFSLNVILVRDSDGDRAELEVEWDPQVWELDAIWRIWTRFARASVPATTVSTTEADSGVKLPLASNIAAFIGKEGKIHYTELPAIARALDFALSDAAGNDRVVAILGHASPRVFAICAAAHLTGAAFVPVDPDLSDERIEHIISASGARILIDLRNGDTDHSGNGVRRLGWNDLLKVAPKPSAEISSAPANRTAYVIFTSGSTGVPKGVAVPRSALASLARWGADLLDLKPGDHVGQTANSAFDASIWEVWPALVAGATVHVAELTTRRDPILLREWTLENRLRTSFSPTPVAELLAKLDWDPSTQLEVLGAGGSALHSIGRPQPFRLLNLYGPTETTSVATYAFVNVDDPEPPTIGQPVPYAHVTLVGDSGEVVRDGHVGELWISGSGVADGYLNDEDLTDARFIVDPRGDGSTRAYRTGDLGRCMPDGRIVYLGRSDRQVKVSGVRLELGELEEIALSTEGITGAIVGPDRTGERLVLFLTTAGPSADPVLAVRSRLPVIAQQSRIEIVSEFPLTDRGKVDFTALVETLDKPLAPSRGEVESFVRELTGASDLSKSWYSCGGTSFTGARLVAWLSINRGIDLSITEVLNATSVADLLASLETEAETGPRDSAKPASFATLIDAAARLKPSDRIELAIKLLEMNRS